MTDSYIGVPPKSGFINTAKQRVTSSTNNYVDLDHAISDLSDVIVWVNSIKQDSTNLSLTNPIKITLGGTLTASDVVEIVYLGKQVATQSPDTGSVTNSMLAGSIANDKLAGSIANSKLANSSITLNGSAVSLGGSATISSSDNTPSFLAYASGGTTVGNDSNAQIAFQTEAWDTDNAFDNSTHYRFTVPSGEAGKYFFGASLEMNITSSTGSVRTQIWKNGTTFVRNNDGGNSYYHNVATYGVVDMAVGDYVEVRAYQNSGGIKTTQTGTADNYFFGYKLAGV